MKFLLLLRPLSCLIIALLLSSCGSDDDAGCVGVDCLPPATQTGAGTFGCLINGVPFVDTSGRFNCFYQNINGELYFNICGSDNINDLSGLCLRTNDKAIAEGESIPVLTDTPGSIYGTVLIDVDNGVRFFDTDESSNGNVDFIKFSINPNIVSGTFEFEAIDPQTGVLYKITNGRFDAQFTQ